MLIVLRALGWILCVGAFVGIVHDELFRSRLAPSDIASALSLNGAGVQATDQGVPGVANWLNWILALPVWPCVLAIGVLVLLAGALYNKVFAKRGGDAVAAVDAPAETRGVAGGTAAVAPGTELRSALGSARTSFIGVAIFSGMVNILMLTGSFFMLEVYDRVLPSRSVATLVGLSLLALVLFVAQGCIDFIRTRMLIRIGSVLDETVSGRVHEAVVRLPLKTATRSDGLQPLRDLDTLRAYLSGLGPTALFDLPWMPLYIGIIYIFHPLLGVVAIVGALLLVAMTLLTEIFTASAGSKAAELSAQQMGVVDASRRNAEVLQAMGMGAIMQQRWQALHRGYIDAQGRASDVALGFGAFSKVLRMMLQSGVLALGAYLVIQQEATAGIIIAGSILVSRALAPIELAIANWRGFVASRQSWRRLNQLLKLLPAEPAPMQLPAPKATLSVEGIFGGPPGETRPIVQDVSFKLEAGDGLAVMGPSASGKSTLARLIVGVWQQARGAVRLDGAAIEQWSSEDLGRFVGYLPQDVELFAGTVAQNIARFAPDASAEDIVKAAQVAGAHDLIVGLADGYETQIGEHGKSLSAGQQQRVALARALYGDPFLIVLDEPNSNLDADGEAALTQAILKVRQRGAIVIVVAHRPSALAALGHVLAIFKGRAQAFGPKEEVLPKILRPAHPAASPAAGPVAAPAAAIGGSGPLSSGPLTSGPLAPGSSGPGGPGPASPGGQRIASARG